MPTQSSIATPSLSTEVPVAAQTAVEDIRLGYPAVRLYGRNDNGHCTCSRGPNCHSPGKHPIGNDWQRNAIRDPATWSHGDDYGICLFEQDRLLLVDVDVKGGKDGRLAFKRFADGLDPSRYLIQTTPSGGYHLLGRIPAGYDSSGLPNGQAAEGLDILRDRRQFVRSPALGYRPYQSLPQLSALPEWPASFLDRLPGQAVSRAKALTAGPGQLITEGDRNSTLFRQACRLRGLGLELEEIRPHLERLNDEQCSPSLAAEELDSIASSACRYPASSPQVVAPADVDFRFDAQGLPVAEGRTMLDRITTAGELCAEPPRPVEYVLDETLARGRVSILAGAPKKGKSTIARALAVAVAQGAPWCGIKSTPGRVLYVALEEHRDDVRADIEFFGGGELDNLDVYASSLPIALPNVELREVIETRGPYALIIIDTVFRLWRPEQGNDYMMTTEALSSAIGLAHYSEAHVLCVYHTRKGPSYGDAFESILGSQGIWASFDAGMIYSSNPQFVGNQRVLKIDGRRHVEGRNVIVELDEESGVLVALGSYGEVKAEELLGYLEESGSSTYSEIASALDWGESTVRRYMKFLESTRRVEKQGKGGRGDAFRWAAVDPGAEFGVPDSDPATGRDGSRARKTREAGGGGRHNESKRRK